MADLVDSFSWVRPEDFEKGIREEIHDAAERYDSVEAHGVQQWKKMVAIIRNPAPTELDIEPLLHLHEALTRLADSHRRKRLYISHRRADLDQARRVAAIAVACGYSYWLDVEDPVLVGLGAAGHAAGKLHAILVAAIIEMALLNSTHLLVLQKGPSPWIPYEFGRAKARKIFSQQVAWWKSPRAASVPEYLYLGRMCLAESDIAHWLTGRQHSKASLLHDASRSEDPVLLNTADLA